MINDVKVNQVKETKLLGVILDERLPWSTQINITITKMGASISVIKRCAKYLTNTSKKQVMQALILSNIDYCPVVWSNLTMDEIKKLQVAQNRAARVVLHCDIRTNVIAMHDVLSWLTVKNRFLYSLLVFFRNILTSKTPFILLYHYHLYHLYLVTDFRPTQLRYQANNRGETHITQSKNQCDEKNNGI